MIYDTTMVTPRQAADALREAFHFEEPRPYHMRNVAREPGDGTVSRPRDRDELSLAVRHSSVHKTSGSAPNADAFVNPP